jgi:predicted RNase H-like HicB family nuclease
MPQYLALVRNDDAQTCTITFPDFPGVSTSTDSLDQVIESAGTMLRLHIMELERRGERVPPPRSLTQIRADPAQQGGLNGAIFTFIPFPPARRPQQHVGVSLDVELVDAIDRVAAQLGLTRSGFLTRAAAMMLAEHGGVSRVLRAPTMQNPQMEEIELPDPAHRKSGRQIPDFDPHEG